MPLRDSWHRTLVYFGLAEEADEYDDYAPEPVTEHAEAALEDRYRERPNVRRLQGRRRRDEFDDIFAEEDDEPQRSRPAMLRMTRAAVEAPNAGRPVAYLASAYALVGREQEAHEALLHHIKLWPATRLNTIEPTSGTADFNSKMHRVIEGLRLAGLPE